MVKKKSLWYAYVLLFTGGLFGAHLTYLGRQRHAFASWSLFGGYFMLGLIYDFFKLPSYVKDANEETQYMSKLIEKMQKHKKSPLSIIKFVGCLLTANTWAFIYLAAIPREVVFGVDFSFLSYLVPLINAVGVHTVGNIGRDQASFKWCLLGAIIGRLLGVFGFEFVSWSSFLSACMMEWKGKSWRRTTETVSHCKTVAIVYLCTSLYCGMIGSYLYFNAEVTDNSGVTIKLREAVDNFLMSPAWEELTDSIENLLEYVWENGFWNAGHRLVELLDPLGEGKALKVMGLSSDATQKEITSRYRALAKEFHPDRYHDPKLREEASQRFIEIQDAYNKLSDIRYKRNSKNRQSSR